jgi:hypothetical protein
MSRKNEKPVDDVFFIGWSPVPAAYRRFLFPAVAVLLLAAAGGAAAVAYLQRDPGDGRWDPDRTVTQDGVAFTRPYAMIRVPGERSGDPPQTLLLVEDGKFGALERTERFVRGRTEGQAVRVTGTVLHRGGRAMLELAEGDAGMRNLTAEETRRLPNLGWPGPEVAERVTVRGEIVDPKCYLGAMKPGGGKTHKACAALCIAGGVPPMLVTRSADGGETFYLLVTACGGAANEIALTFVGEPVEASGRLKCTGDLLVLRVEPDGLRRR